MKSSSLSKIAIIRGFTSFQSITNYNSQELGLARALLKRGVQTDIFYASKDSKATSIQIDQGLNVNYLPVINIVGHQGIMLGLNKIIKQKKYDLVQVTEESSIISFFAAVCAKKYSIPVILSQGMYESHKGFFASILQKSYNFIFTAPFRKSVTSSIAKTQMAKEYLNSKNFKNVEVLPIGLSTHNFNILDENKISKPSKKVVLYIGKLENRRNPLFILELAKRYLDNSNVLFLCIGSGPMAKEVIENKPKNVQVIENVLQKEIKNYYSMADVFILPTDYEIFGMVYLESIYFGVPIVTTINAGSQDILKNKTYSFLEKSLDSKRWMQKIDKFLFDEELIKKVKRDLSKDKLTVTWESLVDDYIRAYQKSLKRNH